MVASNSPECNILIIDDEPAARYVVAGFFRGENCVTYEAENGVEGLRMAREIKPQLVLLDLQMPDMTGYDVLDSLKADLEMHLIPVAWLPRQVSPTIRGVVLSARPARSST